MCGVDIDAHEGRSIFRSAFNLSWNCIRLGEFFVEPPALFFGMKHLIALILRSADLRAMLVSPVQADSVIREFELFLDGWC